MRVLTEKIRKNYTHHTTTNKPQTIQTFSCGGCSRPLYSSHTTPHTTNTTYNHSHNNWVTQPACLVWASGPTHKQWIVVPDTQQCTNELPRKIIVPVYASKNSCYQPLYGWRCVSTPIQQWWHDHIRAINHQPNNTIETSTWWVI